MIFIVGLILVGFSVFGANADTALIAGALCLVASAIDNISTSIDDWRQQDKQRQ